jgi:Cu(I)/Ag(I) efflux system membrane fusion protein
MKTSIEHDNRNPPKHNTFIYKVLLILLTAGGFALGFWVAWRWQGDKTPDDTSVVVSEKAAETIWTCSMHPQIRENKPGKCRICAMDLIPLESDSSGSADQRVISFSPEVLKLMEVQTSPVLRRAVSAEIRLVGKMAIDETRTKTISAWVPGRIDRLYVDYTGIPVNPGDHMVYLYSPDLITAQAEFLEATASRKRLIEGVSELVRQSVSSALTASREKLLLLGLTEDQVKKIEQEGKPLDHLTIYAPMGGVVIEKMATEGMYVQTGMPIYQIADLSKLWVMMDAYESDLTWLRFGQTVDFTAESLPGEVFTGRISFISPLINDTTRTVRVRAVVDNSDGRLKPNMLVRAVVSSALAEGGSLIDPSLADKWICPMHGEIIKDVAGICDICQMPLVTAASLGYTPAAQPAELPLVIPASAALLTGRKLDRAVVYAKIEGAERPTFIGKQVVLGPRAGDMYIVREGLMEGEQVVTHGNFKIDSELQLQGKPSLMNPTVIMPRENHPVAAGEQTLCPVMDAPVNKDLFVEYKGMKVYFCCPGCSDKFLADPEKYLPKLPQFQPERVSEQTDQ